MAKYSVDYWYRHSTDTEQSVRASCQMSARAECASDVLQEIDSLTRGGYTVQRAEMHETCTVCGGVGRIGKAPKGTRKAKIATLPSWRLTYSECKTCKGKGYTQTIPVLSVADGSEVLPEVAS